MKKDSLHLDELLVERGEAKDLFEARGLVMAGKVLVSDAKNRERKIDKAKTVVAQSVGIRIKGRRDKYVSRSGKKLEGGLTAFDIDVHDLICADLGLSTGGFTDCLLQRGAQRVHGVDVDYGRVHWRLRQDDRLVLHERTNARHLSPNHFGEAIDLVVSDVSFISLTAILPAAVAQLAPAGEMLLLVKPQFELPRNKVPEGGIITDPADRAAAADNVVAAAKELGLSERGRADSERAGTRGNLEILLHLAKS